MLIDNLWAWRADHDVPGSVGWEVNTGRNGVIVNGDGVRTHQLSGGGSYVADFP